MESQFSERNTDDMIRKYGNSEDCNAFEAIRKHYAEKNALYDKKEAEILDPLRVERRKMLNRIDAMKAAVALAQKQSEQNIAEKQL